MLWCMSRSAYKYLSMYEFHQPVNLPMNPLRLPVAESVYEWNGNIVNNILNITDTYEFFQRDILSDELLAIFDSIGVEVSFCVLFCSRDNRRQVEDRVLHSDIFLTKDMKWKYHVCAINWELTQCENEFSWWDTTGLSCHFPAVTNSRDFKLKSEHFGNRRNIGIPEGAVKLDSFQLVGPELVRTDRAHIVSYSSTNNANFYNFKNRMSLSVRFVPKWNNWSEARTAFKSILVNPM